MLQPVLSLEAALAEEPRSLQLCFCCLMLPAGSREHPDLWVQVGKERSCASPPDATSLWEPSFPPLLRRGSSACDYDEAEGDGSRARPGPSLCCHMLQQVQHSHLHLFLMSLQWEKSSPLGKQQKENVQRRLMSRFSLSGTKALSQIPCSLRAQATNNI